MAISPKKHSCRALVFESPMPDFSGGLPSESDVARVFFWCEKNTEINSSHSQVLDEVTKRLREHWKSLGKNAMDHKLVKEKINQIIKKVASKVDSCTRLITSPEKCVPQKKLLFQKCLDIEPKTKTKQNVAKVRNVK